MDNMITAEQETKSRVGQGGLYDPTMKTAAASPRPTPRRGSRAVPVLRITSWLDWSPFAEDERGAVPLWYTVHADGPFVERSRSEPGEFTDWIAFGTDEGFTEEEHAALLDSLTEGKTVTLPFRLDTSYSDARDGGGWEDYFCEGCSIELSTDAHSRLKASVTFDNPTEWVDFAKDLFMKRLASPERVQHQDVRLWQLLAWVSPRLRDLVSSTLRRPLEEFLHVELDGSLAAFGSYVSVIPTRIQQRDLILRALLRNNSVFTKGQIGVIFPYDTGAFGLEKPSLAPARHETVQSLLEDAHVNPVCDGRYSTPQIVEQILPIACTRRGAQERYHDVCDELRNLGIAVPDQPVVREDS